MNAASAVVVSLAASFSAVLGVWLFARPAHAIEMQRRFYARINWKIEPLSMEKELRNTKVMGIILIAASILTVIAGIALAQRT
jgi:hypothetical protein